MKRKILSLILAVCMVLALAITANAETIASGTCGDNLTWVLDNSGTLTISGEGAMYDWLTNPQVPWYDNSSSIFSVIIGDRVTSIGKIAFGSCENLTSVTIGNSVATITDYAFMWCTRLTSITIPASVTNIGANAFLRCNSLARIDVSENNINYLSVDGVLFNKNKTILVRYPIGKKDVEDTIPDSVTSIGEAAFSECTNLTNVTIPDSVTSIEYGAFSACDNLTSVTIPNSVTSIGAYAFSNCHSLTSVTIPDSVTSIGNHAFSTCKSLTSVTIPDGVTSIDVFAFEYCYSLTSVTIPDSVTSIGNSAFFGCESLTSITIPDSVTSIGLEAFYWCESLTDVYYSGTKEEWNAITIDILNQPLTSATIHYNYIPTPSFSTSVQAGYHAETKESEKASGEIAVTATVTNLTQAMNNKRKTVGFYFYIPSTGTVITDYSTLSKTSSDEALDLNNKSFYSTIREITDFDASIVFIPYLIYNDDTVHTGSVETVSLNNYSDSMIWLGK